jgi:hypothetical protein
MSRAAAPMGNHVWSSYQGKPPALPERQ